MKSYLPAHEDSSVFVIPPLVSLQAVPSKDDSLRLGTCKVKPNRYLEFLHVRSSLFIMLLILNVYIHELTFVIRIEFLFNI